MKIWDRLSIHFSVTNTLRGLSAVDLHYDSEDRLLSIGDTIYTHDEDGFLVSKKKDAKETLYSYSSRGELKSATLPDGTAIEYTHDPLGRRISKSVNGIIVEKYLWQGRIRLLAIYDGSDNLLMRFEYADARMPVAMTKNGSTFYLIYDQVGSLKVISDSEGVVVKQVKYDSFGYIVTDTDEAFNVPFGFAGGL